MTRFQMEEDPKCQEWQQCVPKLTSDHFKKYIYCLVATAFDTKAKDKQALRASCIGIEKGMKDFGLTADDISPVCVETIAKALKYKY